MRSKTTAAIALAVAGVLVAAGTAFAVSAVTIYRNDMGSPAKRGDLRQLGGGRCERGGSDVALRVEVGRRTRVCTLHTPVVGRDLEIAATGRLLSGTPEALRSRVSLAVNLRDGEGGRYQLAVFPMRREWRLRRDQPPNGPRRLLESGRLRRIGGLNEANKLRLRAFNLLDTNDRDDARLVASVNGRRVAVVVDRDSGPIQGRYSAVSVGATRSATGAVASFDDVLIRVPDPFSE